MSNDDVSVKIEATVGPMSGATISADLEGAVPEGRSILFKRLEIDPGCSHFKVLGVSFRKSKSKEVRDVLESSSHQLAWEIDAGTTTVLLFTYADNHRLTVERHQPVLVSVMNVSDLPRTFSAQLVGEVCTSSNHEEQAASEAPVGDLGDFLRGLADKCRGWFDEGLASAILSAQQKDLERDEIVPEPPRPPRLCDLLRGLVADMITFARIPFYIAQEGCLKMIEKMEGEAPRQVRKVSVAVGPVEVDVGESVAIPVKPQAPFRPTSLWIDPAHCHDFVVEDVLVGNNSQFLTSSPISGIFFAGGEGLPVGIDHSVPGVDIKVCVVNVGPTKMIFRGVLVGVVELCD
jgi:hypothetical protein